MLNIEIWSDIACPWCAIGRARFAQALERFEHRDDVEVTWRSFELDPTAPPVRGGERAQHLAEKYGMSREEAIARQDQLTALGAEDGVVLDFEHVVDGNTFDAHRLIQLGKLHGVQDAVKERLLRAHFAEGVSFAAPGELERLGVEAGLPREEVAELLAGDRLAEAVREDERTARELGVTGVPFFVADRRFAASGAQAPEVLLGLLEHAWGARAVA